MEIAYDNGMLPRETYDDAQDDIRVYAKYYPAMHSTFRGLMASYPAGSDSDVYRMINEALAEANP